MKAITIHQPWASLIALGEKRFETRSWRTHYQGPIAIHAGKFFDKDAWIEPEIYDAIRRHGLLLPEDFPTGAIIAIANLTECYEVKRDVLGGVVILESPLSTKFFETSHDEYAFGDFTSGRFAWELFDVKWLPVPIPAKGQQGLWRWKEGSV